MASGLTRSLLSRLRQGTCLNAGRMYSIRPAPPALADDKARSPTSVIHLYGLPSMKKTSETDNDDARPRLLHKKQEQVAEEIFTAANKHAPVAQVSLANHGKNFGWIEFTKVSDATSFLERHGDDDPFVVGDRAIRISYGDRRSALGLALDCRELALRYNITGISSEEALNLIAQRFPEATVTTNVKSSRGVWGTIFMRFQEVEAARAALESYEKNPIILGETTGQAVSHLGPSTDLFLYNLKPFAPQEEILDSLKKFGDITKYRFPFQPFGPKATGYLQLAFSQLSQAQSLMEATMNEELVIHDRPVRAEYKFMQFNPRPRGENWVDGVKSAIGSTASENTSSGEGNQKASA